MSQSSQYVANVERYVMHHLQELENERITIQTTKGVITGRLDMVHYDCVQVVVEGRAFIVRIAEIIWFTRAEGY